MFDARRHLDTEFEVGKGARRTGPVQDADDDALARVARDHRDAQIDHRAGSVAFELEPEAAVLRPAALRNIELRENLDARDDFPHASIQRLLQSSEWRLAEHAIDAKTHVQACRQHFEMDVAATVLN